MNSPTTGARAKNIRASVRDLQQRPTAQVLIIGGGINGIATFRDLALQGVDVLLVERGDFVSGASSASSHMIHGGIRYLENGEFRLVKESVTERNALLKTAPHCVTPLATTVPIFSTFSGILSAPLRFLRHTQGQPRERGAFLIKVGLSIYDMFSRDGGSVPRHRFRGRVAALRDLPKLNPRLKYSATYFDASMHHPERLALDILHDGLGAGPNARALNYLEVVSVDEQGVVVQDRESGSSFSVAADIVVNVTGPWTDLTNQLLGQSTSYMGGTKGSHIVLDNPELFAATHGREIFFEHSDVRIVLIYPLLGRVMVGTTDIEADPRELAVTTDDEIDYFFSLVAHVFPTIAVERSQIVYSFSGIRPLPRHEDTEPGFVSRDYRIEASSLGATRLLSLVGGKWTTFRALAEHLTDLVLQRLGLERTTSTRGLAIGGGRGFPSTPTGRAAWTTRHGADVGKDRADQLLTRYGTRAAPLITYLNEPETCLEGHPEYSRGEIEYLARTEQVVHLVDLLLRRTTIAFVGDLDRALVAELAEVVGGVLGWDGARRELEVVAATDELRQSHRVELPAVRATAESAGF